jgi:hypothetical protein
VHLGANIDNQILIYYCMLGVKIVLPILGPNVIKLIASVMYNVREKR